MHCTAFVSQMSLFSLFSVRDGVFRQYSGERSMRSLKKYIDNQEWQQTSPISSLFSPSGILYVDYIHFDFY